MTITALPLACHLHSIHCSQMFM